MLELIHSDICGSRNVDSEEGSRLFVFYWLMIIHDSLLYTWLTINRKPSQSFQKHLLKFVEKQAEFKAKQFRCENGEEYVSNEFVKYCSSCGFLKACAHDCLFFPLR